MSPDHPIQLLYAEDESLIRAELEASLREAGFSVTLAVDGEEASAILEGEYAALDGLITDVNLGRGTNGWDLARRARELNPGLPVIYTSGARPGEWFARGVPLSIMIAKVYATSQVITGMSTLLNAPG